MSGMIYTFYSYKGGVGRTMALANLGMYFYKQGYTTLLVDWDLEAPGLERYFEHRFRLNLVDFAERPGLVDMIQKYIETVSQPAKDEDKLPYPPIEDYLYTLDSRNDVRLQLMHAGRRGRGILWENYAKFVQNFDWVEFYEEWEGGTYLEWLRVQMKDFADVILIDSRTGVTEMGGVTTQHLADAVLLFCGANYENIENTARMSCNFVSEAIKKARENRPLDIMVIPSRIDDADSDGFGEFLERSKQEFSEIPMRVLDDGYSIEETIIPYLPAFSYKEFLIVDEPELEKTANRILERYRRIAANMRLLAHDESALSQRKSSVLAVNKRKVLLISTSQDIELAEKLTKDLQDNGIQVKDITKSRTDIQELEQELAQVGSVIILVSETTRDSRVALRLVRVVLDAGKPIIPVITDNASMPFELVDIHAVDIRTDYKQGVSTILRAIRSQQEEKSSNVTVSSQEFKKQIYLSYSRQDKDLAEFIRKYLHENGFQIWSEEDMIMPGTLWRNEIEKGLREAFALIVLVTPASIRSEWVQREIAFMNFQKKPIIPIVLEHTELPLSLSHIQGVFVRQDDIKQSLYTLIKALNQIAD